MQNYIVTAKIDVWASSIADAVTVVQNRVQQSNVQRDPNSVSVKSINAEAEGKDRR